MKIKNKSPPNYSGMLDIDWKNGFLKNLNVIIKELKRILK